MSRDKRKREATQHHRVDGASSQVRVREKWPGQEIGIESRTAIVARTFPRKNRIINAVRQRPIVPSLITFLTAIFTNADWSKTTSVFSTEGISRRCCDRLP